MDDSPYEVVGVVEVQCPHKVGLCYLTRDGGLAQLPCPCNDRSEILRHFVPAPKTADEVEVYLDVP